MLASQILAFMDPVSSFQMVTSVYVSQNTLDSTVKIEKTCVWDTSVVMEAPASGESNNMPVFAQETLLELSASESSFS